MEARIDEVAGGVERLSADAPLITPRTLALMHGPAFAGDGAAALLALADDYDRRVDGALGEALGLDAAA